MSDDNCDTPNPADNLPEPWVPKVPGVGPVEVTPADGACFPIENCADPETGEPAPILVELANPQDQIDSEYVCGESGNWELVVFVNGVESTRTDTGVSCTEPPPVDVEPIQECRDDTLWNVWYAVNPTTSELVEIGAADTGVPCVPEQCDQPLTPECVKVRRYTVGYDNGTTPGSSSNDCGAAPNFIRYQWPFTVDYWAVNGGQVGAGDTTLGPTTSWGPQLTAWAAFLDANDPNLNAEAAFGFNPAPTWRFAEIEGCDPLATYGPLVMTRTDTGCQYSVYPILVTETIEFGYRYATIDCDGAVTINWLDADGQPTAPPEDAACWVPCAFEFSTLIEPDAVSPCETFTQFGCDNDDGTAVVVLSTFCDGSPIPTIEIYTQDSWLNAASADDLVVHELVGDFVDCESGQVIEPPAPEPCEQPTIRECVVGCETAFMATPGRPNNAVPWELIGPDGVEVSGATYGEFSDNMAAAGYTEWIDGEQHWFCPCPGEAADGWILTAGGDTAAKLTCVPIEKTAGPQPTLECAELTVGKNDDRRDSLLADIVDALDDPPPCDYEVLCDESDTPWLVGTGDCAGVITALDGTPTGCETVTRSCANVSPAQDSTTRVIVDGVSTNVPADWATMTQTERLDWYESLLPAGSTLIREPRTQVCVPVGEPTFGLAVCSGRLCALTIWLTTTVEECSGPDGDLVSCGDEEFQVVARPVCSTVAGSIDEVTVYLDGNPVNTYYLDGSTVVTNIGQVTSGYCDKDDQIIDLLTEIRDCLCGPCDETCDVVESGSATGADGVSIFTSGAAAVAGAGIKIAGIDAGLASAVNTAITSGQELLINVTGIGVFAATTIAGNGPYSAGDTMSIQGEASGCGNVGVNGNGTWSSYSWELYA